jgi:ABC-type Fe3+ transport system substrate-binding protein
MWNVQKSVRSLVAAAMVVGVAMPGLALAQDWQAEWDKTLEEAKGKDLNVIIQPNEAFEAVVRVFQERFPDIKTQVSIIHPSQAAPRIVKEQEGNVYNWDVWWSTASNMNNVVLPAGGLEPIPDYLILPEVKEDSNWRDPRYSYTSDRGPFVFIHTHFLQNLGLYNTEMVPGGTLTMENILDPSLKGKIAIRVPSRPHGGTMMLAQMAKVAGIETVRKLLTEMEPVFIDNDQQVTQSVIGGEFAVGIGTTEQTYSECVREGGCKTINMFPVSFMHSRSVSILKNPPNPAGAKIFVNWLLSKEGQEVYVAEWAKTNNSGAFSMRADVLGNPDHAGSTPDFSNLDQYVAVSLDSGSAALKEITELYNTARSQ